MKRTLCEFNSDGVAVFQKLMGAERGKVKSSQPAKVSEVGQKVLGTSPIDVSMIFESRYDFGHYLYETRPEELSTVQYTNEGLWAWISAI